MSDGMVDEAASNVMAENDYDPVEAKFCACLFWLVFHATEDGDFDDIPPEITCPTERNQEGGFLVRPSVVSFLCDGNIYLKVCSQIVKPNEPCRSLWDVIQGLAKAGFYVVDFNDEAVTEERLTDQDLFSMESHLALMDSLVVAFINQSVSIQQVIDAIRTFASFNAAKELPFDFEDAFLLWLNKINATNETRMQKKKATENGTKESPRRFRFKRDQLIEKKPKLFPKLDDLQRDIADGKALLSLMLFYCPNAVTLEDMKLNGSLTSEEMIRNVDLFRELCAQHICTSIFALRTEDFIYTAPELKNNLIALICEVFIRVEVERRDAESLSDDERGNANSQATDIGDRIGVKQNDLSEGVAEAINGDDSAVERQSERIRNEIIHVPENERFEASPRAYHQSPELTKKAMQQSTGVKTGVYGKGQVDLSIEDELQRLKLLSRSRSKDFDDNLPPKPGATSSARENAKIRQPLLSKRSKKQLANFGDGGKCLSNEDLPGLELDDFDLKRSHSMSSVVDRANYVVDPKRSIRAWEGGKSQDDVSRSKSNKISLDFKPNSTPYRSFKLNESYTLGNHADGELNLENIEWQRSSNEEENYVKASNSSDERKTSPPFSSEDRFAWSDQDLPTSSFEPHTHRGGKPLVELDTGSSHSTGDIRGSAGSTCSEDMRQFRDGVKEKLDKDKFVEHDVEPEFIEPQFEDDDMFGLGHANAKTPPHPPSYGTSPRPNRPLGDGVGSNTRRQGDDDELSTIAESSEPSTPTIYSFESVLSNEDSRYSVLSGGDEITPLNYASGTESMLTSRNYEHDTYSPKANLDRGRHNEVASSHYQNTHLGASQLEPRSSYTIISSNLSIDSAIAAGLPIIGQEIAREQTVAVEEPSTLVDDYEAKHDLGTMSNRLGSEHGSDLDDVPINVRVGSRSSRSSSSGISADGARDEVVFETEDGRPGIAVYSSLSEHTAGGSPAHFDARSDEAAVLDAEHVNNDEDDGLTPVQSQKYSTDVMLEDMDGQEAVAVKERTYLSLDFDENDKTSASAFAVCIEPAEKPHGEMQDLSPGRTRNNWSYMEVELREEDPERVLGNFEVNNTNEDADGMTASQNRSNGERISKGRKDNRKTTTSWSEISQDSSSLWNNLKKPKKEQNHCFTKEVEGPVMNWAEYAKLKNAANSPYESEGDVADILDNALDMGISIVDALHKMAETGDKGKITKEDCLSKLNIPDVEAKNTQKRSRARPTCVAKGNDSDQEEEILGAEFAKSSVAEVSYNKPMTYHRLEFEDENLVDTEGVVEYEGLPGFAHSNQAELYGSQIPPWKDFKKDTGPSPLKILSHNIGNMYSADEVNMNQDLVEEDDYYDSPLKNYSSKRWSTTFALNTEDDDFCPVKSSDDVDSPVHDERETDGDEFVYASSPDDPDVELSKDLDNWSMPKRKRCNTYSIGSTATKEAEEKGLPIIDALDNLCQVADQWLTEHRTSKDMQIYDNFIPGPNSKNAKKSGSEDEISAVASRLVEENIFAIENEAEHVINSLKIINEKHVSRNSDNTQRTELLAKSRIKRLSYSEMDVDCSASSKVEEKIADIGAQASIVLESFAQLNQLKNQGHIESFDKEEIKKKHNASFNGHNNTLSAVDGSVGEEVLLESSRDTASEVGSPEQASIVDNKQMVGDSDRLQQQVKYIPHKLDDLSQIETRDLIQDTANQSLDFSEQDSHSIMEVNNINKDSSDSNKPLNHSSNVSIKKFPSIFKVVKNVKYDYFDVPDRKNDENSSKMNSVKTTAWNKAARNNTDQLKYDSATADVEDSTADNTVDFVETEYMNQEDAVADGALNRKRTRNFDPGRQKLSNLFGLDVEQEPSLRQHRGVTDRKEKLDSRSGSELSTSLTQTEWQSGTSQDSSATESAVLREGRSRKARHGTFTIDKQNEQINEPKEHTSSSKRTTYVLDKDDAESCELESVANVRETNMAARPKRDTYVITENSSQRTVEEQGIVSAEIKNQFVAMDRNEKKLKNRVTRPGTYIIKKDNNIPPGIPAFEEMESQPTTVAATDAAPSYHESDGIRDGTREGIRDGTAESGEISFQQSMPEDPWNIAKDEVSVFSHPLSKFQTVSDVRYLAMVDNDNMLSLTRDDSTFGGDKMQNEDCETGIQGSASSDEPDNAMKNIRDTRPGTYVLSEPAVCSEIIGNSDNGGGQDKRCLGIQGKGEPIKMASDGEDEVTRQQVETNTIREGNMVSYAEKEAMKDDIYTSVGADKVPSTLKSNPERAVAKRREDRDSDGEDDDLMGEKKQEAIEFEVSKGANKDMIRDEKETNLRVTEVVDGDRKTEMRALKSTDVVWEDIGVEMENDLSCVVNEAFESENLNDFASLVKLDHNTEKFKKLNDSGRSYADSGLVESKSSISTASYSQHYCAETPGMKFSLQTSHEGGHKIDNNNGFYNEENAVFDSVCLFKNHDEKSTANRVINSESNETDCFVNKDSHQVAAGMKLFDGPVKEVLEVNAKTPKEDREFISNSWVSGKTFEGDLTEEIPGFSPDLTSQELTDSQTTFFGDKVLKTAVLSNSEKQLSDGKCERYSKTVKAGLDNAFVGSSRTKPKEDNFVNDDGFEFESSRQIIDNVDHRESLAEQLSLGLKAQTRELDSEQKRRADDRSSYGIKFEVGFNEKQEKIKSPPETIKRRLSGKRRDKKKNDRPGTFVLNSPTFVHEDQMTVSSIGGDEISKEILDKIKSDNRLSSVELNENTEVKKSIKNHADCTEEDVEHHSEESDNRFVMSSGKSRPRTYVLDTPARNEYQEFADQPAVEIQGVDVREISKKTEADGHVGTGKTPNESRKKPRMKTTVEKKQVVKTEKVRKETKKERFEKFRRSFDDQKTGIFIDFNSNDTGEEIGKDVEAEDVEIFMDIKDVTTIADKRTVIEQRFNARNEQQQDHTADGWMHEKETTDVGRGSHGVESSLVKERLQHRDSSTSDSDEGLEAETSFTNRQTADSKRGSWVVSADTERDVLRRISSVGNEQVCSYVSGEFEMKSTSVDDGESKILEDEPAIFNKDHSRPVKITELTDGIDATTERKNAIGTTLVEAENESVTRPVISGDSSDANQHAASLHSDPDTTLASDFSEVAPSVPVDLPRRKSEYFVIEHDDTISPRRRKPRRISEENVNPRENLAPTEGNTKIALTRKGTFVIKRRNEADEEDANMCEGLDESCKEAAVTGDQDEDEAVECGEIMTDVTSSLESLSGEYQEFRDFISTVISNEENLGDIETKAETGSIDGKPPGSIYESQTLYSDINENGEVFEDDADHNVEETDLRQVEEDELNSAGSPVVVNEDVYVTTTIYQDINEGGRDFKVQAEQDAEKELPKQDFSGQVEIASLARTTELVQSANIAPDGVSYLNKSDAVTTYELASSQHDKDDSRATKLTSSTKPSTASDVCNASTYVDTVVEPADEVDNVLAQELSDRAEAGHENEAVTEVIRVDVEERHEQISQLASSGNDDKESHISSLTSMLENANAKRGFNRHVSESGVSSNQVDLNRNEAFTGVNRQLSENSGIRGFETEVAQDLKTTVLSSSMPSLESDLKMNPFKLTKSRKRHKTGLRPVSYNVREEPLLERLQKLRSLMSKSLTKLNAMGEEESEIFTEVDEERGREDTFVRRRANTLGDVMEIIDKNQIDFTSLDVVNREHADPKLSSQQDTDSLFGPNQLRNSEEVDKFSNDVHQNEDDSSVDLSSKQNSRLLQPSLQSNTEILNHNVEEVIEIIEEKPVNQTYENFEITFDGRPLTVPPKSYPKKDEAIGAVKLRESPPSRSNEITGRGKSSDLHEAPLSGDATKVNSLAKRSTYVIGQNEERSESPHSKQEQGGLKEAKSPAKRSTFVISQSGDSISGDSQASGDCQESGGRVEAKNQARKSSFVINRDTESDSGDPLTAASDHNVIAASNTKRSSYVISQTGDSISRDSKESGGRVEAKNQARKSSFVINRDTDTGLGDPRIETSDHAVKVASNTNRSTYVISKTGGVNSKKSVANDELAAKTKKKAKATRPLNDITKTLSKEKRAHSHENSNSRNQKDEGKSPREPLAPRLAILKMQLEERRRHIEAEKKKMFEKANEERLKIGQQAFWFAVGGKNSGKAEKDVDEIPAETSKKSGLTFFPFSDKNDPSKVSINKIKKPTPRSESPPNECSTPVTRAPVQPEIERKAQEVDYSVHPQNRIGSQDGNYSVHQNRIGSQEVDYSVHQNRIGSQDVDFSVHQNRIGSQTMLESSTLPENGVTYIVERHADGSVVAVDEQGNQVFYDDYHNVPDNVRRASERSSYNTQTHAQLVNQRETDKKYQNETYRTREGRFLHDSNNARGSARALNSAESTQNIELRDEPAHSDRRHHRTAWNDPMKISARDFQTPVDDDFGNTANVNGPMLPDPESHFYYDEARGNVYRRSSDEGVPDHLLPERRAMKLVSEELQSEPLSHGAREIGIVDYQRRNEKQTSPPDSWDLASARSHKKRSPREDIKHDINIARVFDHDARTRNVRETNTRAQGLTPRAEDSSTPRHSAENRVASSEVAENDQAVVGLREESPTPRRVSPRDGNNPMIDKLGEEIESPAEMTPEQMKKREKFLQNRVKRQQEEKAKKDAEIEKRRRKEEKLRDRKASLERRELGEQEKLRKKKENEARRKKEDEEIQRKKDEQSWRLRHYTGGEKEEDRSPSQTKPRSQISGNNNGSMGNIRHIENETFHQGSPGQSTLTEYRGPPVYVKPTGKSNRQIIVNAITHCCLSGEVNKEAKEKSLQVVSHSNTTHFFVLFREGLKFRGLYSYLQEDDEAQKIYGVGPKVITNKMVEKLYKYSSGGKSFSQIPAKSLSIQVDGILIKKEFWQSSKAAALLPSKTDSNLKKPQTYASRSEMLRKGSPKSARR